MTLNDKDISVKALKRKKKASILSNGVGRKNNFNFNKMAVVGLSEDTLKLRLRMKRS